MPGIDAYTKLLVRSDHTDGSVVFPDISGQGHTITANGDIHHAVAQKKFLASSIQSDGTGDSLTVANHADFDPVAGDFTIDGWFRLSASAIFIFFTKRAGSANFAPYIVYADASRVLYLLMSTDGATWSVNASGSALALNTWYHIAVARYGTSAKLYVNGAVDISGTLSGSLMTNTDQFCIGANADNSHSINGYFEELRVSKGIARWTSAFTPPTEPYSADTVAVTDRIIPAFAGFPAPNNPGFLPGLSPSGLIRQNRKGFSQAF